MKHTLKLMMVVLTLTAVRALAHAPPVCETAPTSVAGAATTAATVTAVAPVEKDAITVRFEAALAATKSEAVKPQAAVAATDEKLNEAQLFAAHSMMTYYYGLNALRARAKQPQDFLLKPENVTFGEADYVGADGEKEPTLALAAEVKSYLPDVKDSMLCNALTKYIDGGHRLETVITWVANGAASTFTLRSFTVNKPSFDINGDGQLDRMFSKPEFKY